jgi:ParB-like chromosome segregation protein Spo0J
VTMEATVKGPRSQERQSVAPALVALQGEQPDASRPPDPLAEVVHVAVLVHAGSPRSHEDEAHVQRLVDAEWPLPPILVHRPTMQIVDGHHRVSAAIRKGIDEIEACFIDGSLDSAFIAAVEANARHGLPLSVSERRAAAAKILQFNAYWSDRSISTMTGLSAKTVTAIRCATAENPQLHTRLGRDGRKHPLDATEGRRIAAELIALHPNSTLREIAQAAGISPGTVRDVRARLRRGDDPIPARDTASQELAPYERKKSPRTARDREPEPADVNPVLLTLSRDPALRMSAAGRDVLRWLHSHAVNSVDGTAIANVVPDHCVDHLIELANRCAANWARIAHDLTQRSTGTQAPAAELGTRVRRLPAEQCS